jgi:hypothetical protein
MKPKYSVPAVLAMIAGFYILIPLVLIIIVWLLYLMGVPILHI